jgi:hypothetical protein
VNACGRGARRPPPTLVWLLVTGLASLVLYVTLAVGYPLAASLAMPRATWASLSGLDLRWFAAQLAIYLGLSLLYIVAIRRLTAPGADLSESDGSQPHRSRWLYGLIVGAWLAWTMVLMTMAPAGESHDLFDYIFRGRMMVELHANPLVELPNAYASAPYYLYLAWHSNVDTYGPLWEMASAGVAASVHWVAQGLGWWKTIGLSCPDRPASCRLLMVYITGYRLLACTLTGVCAGLIAAIVRRSRPHLVPAALVVWLWNPLTLLSTAVGGHNDLLLLALWLASLWLMQRQRPFLALLTLILAAQVKLTALIWLPVYVLWIVRKWGWRRAVGRVGGGLVLGLAISWLLYLPFGGWATLPRMLYERSLYLANSPSEVIYNFGKDLPGWPQWVARHLTTQLPNWLFLISVGLWLVWRFNFLPKRWRRSQNLHEAADDYLWASITWMGLLYLLIGAFWFQPWYLLWVLAPAALLPAWSLTRKFLPWLTFGAASAILSGSYLLGVAPEGAARSFVSLLVVVMIWGPGLAARLISDLRKT